MCIYLPVLRRSHLFNLSLHLRVRQFISGRELSLSPLSLSQRASWPRPLHTTSADPNFSHPIRRHGSYELFCGAWRSIQGSAVTSCPLLGVPRVSASVMSFRSQTCCRWTFAFISVYLVIRKYIKLEIGLSSWV